MLKDEPRGRRIPSRNDCQGSPKQPSLWEERWGQGACRSPVLGTQGSPVPGKKGPQHSRLCGFEALGLGCFQTSMGSCSSRAVTELATSNQAAACALGWGSDPAPSPALLLAGCLWQGFRTSSQEGAEVTQRACDSRDICLSLQQAHGQLPAPFGSTAQPLSPAPLCTGFLCGNTHGHAVSSGTASPLHTGGNCRSSCGGENRRVEKVFLKKFFSCPAGASTEA